MPLQSRAALACTLRRGRTVAVRDRTATHGVHGSCASSHPLVAVPASERSTFCTPSQGPGHSAKANNRLDAFRSQQRQSTGCPSVSESGLPETTADQHRSTSVLELGHLRTLVPTRGFTSMTLSRTASCRARRSTARSELHGSGGGRRPAPCPPASVLAALNATDSLEGVRAAQRFIGQARFEIAIYVVPSTTSRSTAERDGVEPSTHLSRYAPTVTLSSAHRSLGSRNDAAASRASLAALRVGKPPTQRWRVMPD